MQIPFSKYSGCGNDFILIDNRTGIFPLENPLLVQRLCARRTGIGADGIILLENSTSADYRMRILNADGSEAEMCGNGIRCLARFLTELSITKTTIQFQTKGGPVKTVLSEHSVQAEMPIPTDIHWNRSLQLSGKTVIIHTLNTGVPHAVLFVDDLPSDQWMQMAPQIRNHSDFGTGGTNVNFARVEGSKIFLRTYERGVEGETLACGTGATATALAASKLYGITSPITIIPASGDRLEIQFQESDKEFSNVIMSGPAHHIYKGTLVL
jgi:diaminopimelate epimerase